MPWRTPSFHKIQFTNIVLGMTVHHIDARARNSSGKTDLYLAAQDGPVDAVKAVLASTAESQGPLNLAETVNGRTRIFIASINGRLKIVKLLKAGAEQIICDLAGWTEKIMLFS